MRWFGFFFFADALANLVVDGLVWARPTRPTGRVIDIRSGIAGQVTTGGSAGQVNVAVVETPVVTEMKQRLDEQGTAQEVIER